jgi:alcohol dehydrogenase
MKAWRLEKLGGNLTYKEIPALEPRAGAVVVKLSSSSLMSYMKDYVEPSIMPQKVRSHPEETESASFTP